MSAASSSPGVRSPQTFKSSNGSTPNSDEILSSGGSIASSNGSNTIPMRPPRQQRQRSETTSSPLLSSSQYYQQYHNTPGHHESFYSPSTYSQQSPRPSPRSTPNAFGAPPQIPPPPSPMTFQLPPSALSISAREDSLRSGSIPLHPSTTTTHYQQGSHTSSPTSHRSPHMSPGLSSSGNLPAMPPLSLPDSFLEDQEGYAGYYTSDVGILASPTLHSNSSQNQMLMVQGSRQQQQQQQQHHHQQQQMYGYQQPSSSDLTRQGARSGASGQIFLPSPHLTPSASPLSIDFPSLSLDPRRQNNPTISSGPVTPNGTTNGTSSGIRDRAFSLSTISTDDSVTSRNSLAPRVHSDTITAYPEGFYQGQPHVPVESFLMPTQEQYPPDSLILHGGTAVHSEGGLFKKDAKEYLMLTNSSLLKFKTMEKASKVFGNQSVWSSSSGHQMLTPQQTSAITKDHRLLSLNSIVGIHALHPVGGDVQVMIEYLVSISSQPATMHFTPPADQLTGWLQELRQGCNHHASQAALIAKGTRQRQWIQDKMLDDYISLPANVSENHPTALAAGGMWRAYFRSQKIKGVPVLENGANTDVKVPLEGKVVVIAIGNSFVHILPHNLGNGSAKDDMKDERTILQYPILTIRSIVYKEKDDTFTMSFGTTLRQRTVQMTFASARAREIIIALRARVESLRWLYPLGRKGIDLTLSETLSRPIPVPSKEYLPDLGFEDLLRAECSAMNVDRKVFNNVRVEGFVISIDKPGDSTSSTNTSSSAPTSPTTASAPSPRRDYTVDEMKVLLRALRFNTTFKEINFSEISFLNLQKSRTLKDGTLRYGLRLDQEFYELIMGNPQIRVLNLHNCKLDTSTVGSIGRAIRDGYPAGLRLEVLDLYGNHASDGADVMTLAKGIVKHAGTLHRLDVGNCQITGDGINQIMHAFVANPDVASHTLEFFGIHANPESKVNSFILDMFLKHSMRLEVLSLSDLTSWSKSPILMAETLAKCGGTLKRLDLSGMALHPTTLDQLVSWLSTPGCESLEQVKIEGCGMDGGQFANLLEAIGQGGNPNIEVLAGRNLLSDGSDLTQGLVSILAAGETTTSLGFRQTCWSEPALRQLFVALSQNYSLKKLDLSSVSLASGRDPDVETCKLLGHMLSSPASRLEELNLQGEETTELTSRMGRNLWRSFEGLGHSRYLSRLDLRRNRFKDEGALALAEALRVNQSLTWLDMDENDVTTEGFNAILSAFHQGGTDQVPTSSRYYNSTLACFVLPTKDTEKQTHDLKESMLETYKAEQEIRFLLGNSTGKDSREWKERLAQVIRTRNQSADAIARLDRAIQGIAGAVDRNKAAMDAVLRDRERRRERDREHEQFLREHRR